MVRMHPAWSGVSASASPAKRRRRRRNAAIGRVLGRAQGQPGEGFGRRRM